MAPLNAALVSRRAFLGVLGTVAIAAALPPAVAGQTFTIPSGPAVVVTLPPPVTGEFFLFHESLTLAEYRARYIDPAARHVADQMNRSYDTFAVRRG